MVTVSVRPSRSARHEADGDIVLTNGRTTLLSDISGVKWTPARLLRLAAAVQRQMDLGPSGTGIRLIADLVGEGPDKVHAFAGDDAWFSARYGERMFIDGDSLVSRSDEISFTFEPTTNEDGSQTSPMLVPHISALT